MKKLQSDSVGQAVISAHVPRWGSPQTSTQRSSSRSQKKSVGHCEFVSNKTEKSPTTLGLLYQWEGWNFQVGKFLFWRFMNICLKHAHSHVELDWLLMKKL